MTSLQIAQAKNARQSMEKAAEGALATAEEPVRTLHANLAGEGPAKQGAETAKTGAADEMAGDDAARAGETVKDPAAQAATAAPAEVDNPSPVNATDARETPAGKSEDRVIQAHESGQAQPVAQ